MALATIRALLGALFVVTVHAWDNYTGVPYENFWFSVNNRAGVCNSPWAKCPKLDNPKQVIPWTIFGLWPVKGRENTSFHDVNVTAFVIDDIEPVRNDLERFWSSHNSSSNELLWAHEFMEYGIYAIYQGTKIASALEYFNVSLQLYKHFDVARWLADRQIVPSNKKPVSRGDIERAVSLGFSANRFYLYCQGQKNGIDILREIRLCFDSSLEPTSNCSQPKITCLSQGIWYLEDSENNKGTPSGSFVAAVTIIALFMSRN